MLRMTHPIDHSKNPLAEDLDHILRHTEGLWEPLRGGSVFITGGTGFFGRWLLESFAHINRELGLGAKALVLSRNPDAFIVRAPHLNEAAGIAYLRGDVRDFTLPSEHFSHVIHAGTTSGAAVEPKEMFDSIVDGTRRVLEFASTHGVRQLLFVSSGAVYGRQPGDLTHIPEDFPGAPDSLDPSSAYGEGKRAGEFLSNLAGSRNGFETKIARCFAFVGPHLPLDAHFAVGNFIRDGLRGGPIQVSGDGTPYRSYLYAADLAIWLWTILFRGTAGRAYNVGSPSHSTIREVAETVEAALGLKTPAQIAKTPALNQVPSRYVPDVERARRELGLVARIDLATAVRRTAQWAGHQLGSQLHDSTR